MRSGVYLTLSEVKRLQEPVHRIPRYLLLLLPLGKRKVHVHFPSLVTHLLVPPQNSLENCKHPTDGWVSAERRAQTPLPSPPVISGACQHCQKAREFMSNHPSCCEGEKEKKKNQWLNKILWDTLLGFTIKMYYVFLDSTIYTLEKKMCCPFYKEFFHPTSGVFNTLFLMMWPSGYTCFFFPFSSMQKLQEMTGMGQNSKNK